MPDTDLIVLGAGRPTGIGLAPRSADRSMVSISLPWIKAAVRKHVETSYFVAGFEVEQFASRLDGFSVEYNARWQETGSVASLLCVPLRADRQALVSYADIVFRESIVERLLAAQSDIAIAVDSRWRERFSGRTKRDLGLAEKVRLRSGALVEIGRNIDVELADAEFAGLVRLSPAAVAVLQDRCAIPATLREKGGLANLVGWLGTERGLTVSCFDVEGDWAELNAPQDLSRFVLGTKAETLDRLRPLVRTMRIEDQVRFTVGEWDAEADRILSTVRSQFSDRLVIVRSSARSEDGWVTANAGAYTSVANVCTNKPGELNAAIEQVINSYGRRRSHDQVLIQPMLTDVVANGVLFTRTLSHGAPYFVLNYDETPGCTDAVTAGSGELRILYMHHDAADPPVGAPSWVASLISGARELIELVGYDTLDMEFVIGPDDNVHMLQLRPIAVDHADWVIDDDLLASELHAAVSRYKALEHPSGHLRGGQPVFGVMPDWNPAEIIGTRPSLLSVSLYRYLITDEIWARQRAEYGYHDVRPQPLMVSFAGRPYVNVRASFRSFIPASIPEPLADRLVDHYVTRLVGEPALHDKIEFSIAFTCLSFDFYDRAAAELKPAGFGVDDIDSLRVGLARVTNNGIARCSQDLATVEALFKRYRDLMVRPFHPLERACALLEDCRRFGTLPFAHLARSGFVAVALMRSAVDKGFIDQTFLDRYLQSMSTVAKDFVRDGTAVSSGALEWQTFLDRYGHLRPGTYDITSPSYRDDNARLLRDAIGGSIPMMHDAACRDQVEWPDGAWPRMQAALATLGIDIEQGAFDQFVRSAIEGREYAKFIFSRNLSQALDDLAAYGRDIGVERETLACLPIASYFALRAGEGFGEPAAFIRSMAQNYEPRRMLSRNIELPPLIHDTNQFFSFFYPASEPNFITSHSLTGPVRCLVSGSAANRTELIGRIAVISQADPGFDWLFGCGIAGLITQYGGANSHMAIRAAEFGIPAAIGVGDILFEKLQHSKQVKLDCLNRKIEIFR